MDVPSEHLCDNRTQLKDNWIIRDMKKCGVFDVERKCVALVYSDLKFNAVCERNCTKFDCLKLKSNAMKAPFSY